MAYCIFADDIKTMQLYNNIDRIWKDLEHNHGYNLDTDEFDPSIVNQYDCYNYGVVEWKAMEAFVCRDCAKTIIGNANKFTKQWEE